MKTIVFVIRGCHVGWLGAYGNEWVATPNLDRFAAESVVFDRHISDQPDRSAALASWFGGAPGLPVLTALRAAGVATVLVRANHPDTDGPDWFYAAWGEVFDARPQEEDPSPLDLLARELPAVLDRLSTAPDFLLWIEIDRLLPPWDVRQDVFEAYVEDEQDDSIRGIQDEDENGEADEETDESERDDAERNDDLITENPQAESNQTEQGVRRELDKPTESATPWFDPPTGPFDTTDPDAWEWLHATFAAVVTTLDAELGRLFDQLRERGLDQSAAWLLTSDHGYPLGEHGQIGLHRPWLHEELVHLPLILRLPDAAEACRRVAGFTQPPDIASTLLDLFGKLPTAATSLLPLAHGEGEIRDVAISALELNGASELSLRTNEWVYLHPDRVPDGETREPQLFEKPDDRWEVNDVRSRNIERADELESRLKAIAKPTSD